MGGNFFPFLPSGLAEPGGSGGECPALRADRGSVSAVRPGWHPGREDRLLPGNRSGRIFRAPDPERPGERREKCRARQQSADYWQYQAGGMASEGEASVLLLQVDFLIRGSRREIRWKPWRTLPLGPECRLPL